MTVEYKGGSGRREKENARERDERERQKLLLIFRISVATFASQENRWKIALEFSLEAALASFFSLVPPLSLSVSPGALPTFNELLAPWYIARTPAAVPTALQRYDFFSLSSLLSFFSSPSPSPSVDEQR